MEMWYSVPVENFVVTNIHIQIGLRNDVLINLLGVFYYGVEKLYIGEEVGHNTLIIVNQVISKRRQKCQIWDFNDGVILLRKDMHIKQHRI